MTTSPAKDLPRGILAVAALIGLIAFTAGTAHAHCDGMDGPVVVEAREALSEGEVTPLLKWVAAEDEEEVRHAFEETLTVRDLSDEARELADRYFLETLVRLHRESEGAPYTGLKPSGTPVHPVVSRTDRALEHDHAKHLVDAIVEDVRHGLAERFAKAAEAKARAGESVEAGREYVHAYVDLVHYAKAIAEVAGGQGHHGHGQEGDAHAAVHGD